MRSMCLKTNGRRTWRLAATCFGALWSLTIIMALRTEARARGVEVLAGLSAGLDATFDSGEGSEGVGARVLMFNGARFDVEVKTVEGTLRSVLDAAASRCVRSAFGTRSWLRALPDPVVRLEGPEGGMVACLVPDRPFVDATALARALDGFVEGWRLDAIGRVDFLIASPAKGGVLIRHLRSSGPVALEGILPSEGDVEGEDPVGLPRPPSARRVLVAGELGTDPGLAGYVSSWSPAPLLEWYGRRVESDGWEVIHYPSSKDGEALVVRRGESMRLIAVSEDAEGSVVALARLR
jgi:hypothetical protein